MKTLITAAVAAVLCAGCASSSQFQKYPGLDESNTPTATVHVSRTNSVWGAGITAPVYVNRYLIGRLGPGGALTVRVPVGRVDVTSSAGDVVLQTVEGESYYLSVNMPPQVWFYAPDFDMRLVDNQKGTGK